jgi:coenzyme Q-binding protein COQ10
MPGKLVRKPFLLLNIFMPSFKTSRLVKHSASQMYDLVVDVESYPHFLPLCAGLRVKKRGEAEGKLHLVADMSIGYKAIRESFTSKAVCNPENLEIHVQYVDGPFKQLKNRWKFTDIEPKEAGGTCCLVEFEIEYEFKSRTLALLMGSVFDVAFRSFAEAFEKRAHAIYGAGKLSGTNGVKQQF